MTMIDEEAKLPIKLFRQTDTHGKFFYIGKMQFPGTLDLTKGVSFMIFTSERDKICPSCREEYKAADEKLLIGPIRDNDMMRMRNNGGGGTRTMFNRLCIDLRPFTDADGNIGYVGEAKCPTFIDTSDGLFFTIFLSREGSEELQISRLDHNRRKARNDYELDAENNDIDDDDEEEDYVAPKVAMR